ncbi:glycosyltransferase family 4 protein [Desulforhopalus sp. 52FAK]
MKVGMIVWSFWPGPEGGAERQCRKVTQQLVRTKTNSVVLTSLSSYKLNRKSTDGSVTVLRFGLLCPCSEFLRRVLYKLLSMLQGKHEKTIRSLMFWLMLPLEWLSRLSFILEVILTLPGNKLGLKIIHVHETSWLAGFGVLLGKRWKVPVVCKVRNTPALEIIGYDTPFRKTWSKLRKEAEFIALHPELERELILLGIVKEKIHLVPNGVELPELGIKQTTLDGVLYVGNFTQGASHKGFDTLLLAWPEVIRVRPGAHLTLVGGGDISTWKALVKDLGCIDSVTFTGKVSDPQQYYRQADVFVLPSRHEGMSNALLEAQSWGIPCVVSDISANAAIIINGKNGLIFPVDNAHIMAQNILSILSDSGLKATLGENARKIAEIKFNIERVAEKLVSVYSHVCGRG